MRGDSVDVLTSTNLLRQMHGWRHGGVCSMHAIEAHVEHKNNCKQQHLSIFRICVHLAKGVAASLHRFFFVVRLHFFPGSKCGKHALCALCTRQKEQIYIVCNSMYDHRWFFSSSISSHWLCCWWNGFLFCAEVPTEALHRVWLDCFDGRTTIDLENRKIENSASRCGGSESLPHFVRREIVRMPTSHINTRMSTFDLDSHCWQCLRHSRHHFNSETKPIS